MDPLVISAAITGGEHGREATPHLPITPEEIAQSAFAAYQAGAAVVHIHVRDDHGEPSHDLDKYKFVMSYLADRCDVIVNLTTEPGGNVPQEERVRCLELSPELATFDAGTMHVGDRILFGSMEFLRQLAIRMKAVGTKPELEIFHSGMIDNCLRLSGEGLLEPPLYFQFVLGLTGAAQATLGELEHLRSLIPSESPWSVTGIGRYGVDMAMLAIVRGGNVRVGLEDQIYYSKGVLAETNAELVARIVRLAHEFGRPVAKPHEARRLFGLRQQRLAGSAGDKAVGSIEN